jgi:hypothetical protein
MVTLAQQNQRHEFSCPPNLSSSTWATTTRWWSLKCDQHARVSGISCTSVCNVGGHTYRCFQLLPIHGSFLESLCAQYVHVHLLIYFPIHLLSDFSWEYNESMEKMIQCSYLSILSEAVVSGYMVGEISSFLSCVNIPILVGFCRFSYIISVWHI